MSVEEEEHSGAAATSSEGCGPVRVWAQEPLPPLPVVCTDWRISTSWASPCWSRGRGAEDGRRDPSAPSLGTGSRRHYTLSFTETPLCLVLLHSVCVLQKDGRTWVLAGLCILCIRGSWPLRGQRPAPNKVVFKTRVLPL